MILFTIFRSLGLSVSVRPMLDPNDDQLSPINEYRAEEEAAETGQPVDKDPVFRIGEEFRETAFMEVGGYDMSLKEEEEVRAENTFMHHIEPLFPAIFISYLSRQTTTGMKLIFEQMIQDGFPHTLMKNLTWLNSPAQPGSNGGAGLEVALVNITYGNQAELTWHYSYAVILIEIPKRGERPNF